MYVIIRFNFFLLLLLFVTACGPTPPTEAEIKDKIIGTFCTENYKLTLTDSTYYNLKLTPGVLTNRMIPESCTGTYALTYRDEGWYIEYNKDDSPNAIYNCKRSYLIWSKEEEYLIGKEVVVMKDLLDEKELRRSSCDE